VRRNVWIVEVLNEVMEQLETMICEFEVVS
jgi:hypothetical protein